MRRIFVVTVRPMSEAAFTVEMIALDGRDAIAGARETLGRIGFNQRATFTAKER